MGRLTLVDEVRLRQLLAVEKAAKVAMDRALHDSDGDAHVPWAEVEPLLIALELWPEANKDTTKGGSQDA